MNRARMICLLRVLFNLYDLRKLGGRVDGDIETIERMITRYNAALTELSKPGVPA